MNDPREYLLRQELRRLNAYLVPGPQPAPFDHLAKLAGLRFCPDQLTDTFIGIDAAGRVTLPIVNINRVIFGTVGANNYTPSKATRFMIVEVLGGGGGGGATLATAAGQTNGGGGGGGGEAQIAVISNAQPVLRSITVGGGGAGGVGGQGGTGGTSTFVKAAGETGTAPVGLGGQGGFLGGNVAPPAVHSQPGAMGNQGTTVFGPTIVNVHGTVGQHGLGFKLGINQQIGGAGGRGGGTYGGGGSLPQFDGNGNPGETWGGGGGGAAQDQSLAARTGGAGAQGIIVVFEYLGPA